MLGQALRTLYQKALGNTTTSHVYIISRKGEFDFTRCYLGHSIRMYAGDLLAPRFVGWCTPVPEPQDTALVRMKSGKIGKYRFTAIARTGEPVNMFRATGRFIGYA